MKEQIRAWLNERLVKGFYRAHSWLLNLFGFLVVVLPDIVNYAVSNIDSFVGSIPTLSIEHKLTILATVNVLSLIFKAWKQRNGPIAIAERETAAATEVFLDGSMTTQDTQQIIKEIEQHLSEQIKAGTGSVSRAIRDTYVPADRK